MAMAGVMSWQLQWTQDGVPESLVDVRTAVAGNRSPMCFIIGTACLCMGMLACAALIGESTEERRYQRKTDEAGKQRSQLFWVQPGNQVVGDETFDAFAYIEDAKDRPLSEYTISSKKNADRFHPYTWVAIVLSLGGYIAQFIGLRGMNASVSIAQLGITLFMSLLRAILRMRRLKRTDNRFANIPDKVVGHELDWLAFELAADDSATNRAVEDKGPEIIREGKICGWHLTGNSSFRKQDNAEEDQLPNDSERLLRYRTRLADLTGHQSPMVVESSGLKAWGINQVLVRDMAHKLSRALCGAADALLGPGQNQNSLVLRLPIMLWRWRYSPPSSSTNEEEGRWDRVPDHEQEYVAVVLDPPNHKSSQWTTDSARLEGILGLWLWSLKQTIDCPNNLEEPGRLTSAAEVRTFRLVFSSEVVTDLYAMENELNLWLGQSGTHILPSVFFPPSQWPNDASAIWTQSIQRVSPDERRLGWVREGSGQGNPMAADPSQPSSERKQFFGWQFISPFEERESTSVTYILYNTVGKNLLAECCRDIYSTSLVTLVNTTSCIFDKVRVIENMDQVRLEEPKISAIIAAFTENGLGSRSDAILCVIPGIRTRIIPKKGEFLQSSITSILQRSDENLIQGFHLLDWIYSHSMVAEGNASAIAAREVFVSGLIAVCEFYRKSLGADQTEQSRHLGYEMMLGLMDEFRLHSGKGEGEITDILTRYCTVTMQIAIDYAETCRMPASLYEGLSNIPSASEFLDVIKARNRTETLYLLCIIPTWHLVAEFEHALPLAARNGWDEVVTSLLELGAVVDSQVESGRTALSYYCATPGSFPMVKTLLDSGSHPDLPDGKKCTPLWWAARAGDREVVKALRDTGKVLLDAMNEGGRSPLSVAAESNHREIIKLLRDTGLAKVDLADDNGRTPFSYAAGSGHATIIRDLAKDSRVDPDSRDSTGRTPLSWAAGNGHVETVRLLIQLPNVNRQSVDEERRTPLLWAVENSHVHVVRELCVKDGGLAISDIYGLGPLARAARVGSVCVVEELLNHIRPSEEPADDMGRTALWWALRTGGLGIAKLLLKAEPSSIDTRDSAGRTPLWWAARNGQDVTIVFLLENGADPATSDFNGETPVLWAARNGHAEAMQLLLNTGRAEPDARGSFGRTPLMWAARRGDLSLVKMLLEVGKVNVALRDDEGRTALSWALKTNNRALKDVLSAGVDISLADSW